MELQPGEKLWACVLTKSAVQKYGSFCNKQHKRVAVYHGSVSYKTKRDAFAAPDEAWRDKDVVLSNTCLTVAVDPKTSVFKTIFFHSSRLSGTLREGFQNLCRPNRHLSTETEIVCFLDCRDPLAVETEHRKNPTKLKEYEGSLPNEGLMLNRVRATEGHRAKVGRVVLGHSVGRSDDWVLRRA